MTDAFSKLELSPDGLRLLPSDRRFAVVTHVLRGVVEPAARTALAMELFGRRGAELPLYDDRPTRELIAEDLYRACAAKLDEKCSPKSV